MTQMIILKKDWLFWIWPNWDCSKTVSIKAQADCKDMEQEKRWKGKQSRKTALPTGAARIAADHRRWARRRYEYRGYRKGARSIYMRLLHMEPLTVMNIKKIPVWCGNTGFSARSSRQIHTGAWLRPCKQVIWPGTRLTAGSRVIHRAKHCWPTLPICTTGGDVCYLSTIFDVCTHEMQAYRLNDNLRVNFVLDTMDKLCGRYSSEDDRLQQSGVPLHQQRLHPETPGRCLRPVHVPEG